MLYLHGVPSCRREQLLFPEAVLSDLGLRVISIDRPGWGSTDPLRGDRVARSSDALDVADHLGIDTFSLMAVSSGGSYAVVRAATSPERVERVVLVGGQMPYDDDDAISTLVPDQLALLPALRQGRNERLVAGIDAYRNELLAAPFTVLEPTLATFSDPERALVHAPWFRAALEDEIREGLRASVEGLVEDLLTWPKPFEVDLSDVRCPVRAIHGTIDDWEPLSNLRRFLPAFRDAQLFTVDGGNHLAPMVHPYVTLSLLTG